MIEPEMRLSPVLHLIMSAIAVLAIAVPALLLVLTPRVAVSKVPVLPPPKAVVVPKTIVPPVEPLALVDMTPDQARAFNAAVAFSTAPNPAARAFRFPGGTDDRARALDCLAAAAYYEAGDDSVGERAVAQVVVNRLRHPAFPKTICGVVFEGAERATGCQFTFTCDGAMDRYAPSPAAWDRARAVARLALDGSVDKAVGYATHYHTDWVVPYWSANLDKITEVHSHLFFRWAGWWGTPAAFRRGYAGSEPLIAQLAKLSPAHRTGDPDTLPDMLAGTPAALATLPTAAVPQPVAGNGDSFLVTLDPKLDPERFPVLAIQACGDRPHCKFLAWRTRAETPPELPLSAEQVSSLAFSYLRNEATNFTKALWNCDYYSRPSPVQCMRSQSLAQPAPSPTSAASPPGPAGLTGVRRKQDAAFTLTLATPTPAPTPTPR